MILYKVAARVKSAIKQTAKRKWLLLVNVILASIIVTSCALLNSEETPTKPLIDFTTIKGEVFYGKKNNQNKITLSFNNQGSPYHIRSGAQKNIKKYINIKPSLPGTWSWTNQQTLQFNVTTELKPNTKYEVGIAEDFFTSEVDWKNTERSFTTSKFHCQLKNSKFYINPKDAKETRILSQLECNYPIASGSIAKANNLKIQNNNINIKSELSGNKKTADLTSDIIKIDNKEHYATLVIGDSLSNVFHSTIATPLSKQVKVPSIDTIFKIQNVHAHIVRKDDGYKTPQQVLTIKTSLPVSSADLAAKLEVYLVPRYGTINDTQSIHYNRLRLEELPVSNDPYSRQTSYLFDDISKDMRLYVRINKGLRTKAGYIIKKKFTSYLNIPSYPKEVSIVGSGTVLNLKGDKKLSFYTRGIDKVDISLKRILPNQINHLITQTNGNLANLNFNNYHFSADNITEVFHEERSLNAPHPKELNYSHIDFASYLKTRQGVFFLTIKDKKTHQSDKRVILITDIGIIAKMQHDRSSKIFVTSIRNQQPLVNAKVEILGKNGIAIQRHITDSNGYVSFPDLKNYKNEKSPIAISVTYGQDIAFLPYNRNNNLNYSSFDVGGEYKNNRLKNDIKAYIFTDRNIYRPGDKANLASIIKRSDFQPLQNIPLEIEIRNPKNKIVYKDKIALPSGGVFDFDFQSEYTSLTGNYGANIYLIKQHHQRDLIGSKRFTIEEFEPDKIKILTNIIGAKTIGWNNLSNLQAKVRLENMFGLPAQNNLVHAKVDIIPTDFFSRKFKDYNFTNPLITEKESNKTHTITLPKQRTDKSGNAVFDIALNDFAKGFYRLNLHAEGFDVSDGKSVKSNHNIFISSEQNLVGYKADGKLDYINLGTRRNIEFITIDDSLTKKTSANLTLKTYRKDQISTLVQDRRGIYSYQTVEKKSFIEAQSFVINTSGTSHVLNTKKPGQYTLVLENMDGKILSQIDYFIAGGNNLDFNLENDNNLEVKLNKSSYKNGENIELNIHAPYNGYGLITIEKDKVYSYKWFKSSTNSTIQNITLPYDLETNAYINVAFIRSLDSKEIFTSPLSYAVVPLAIDKSKRQIEIDLEVPEIHKPNEDIIIKYKSSKPAKMIIFGVDEGILQVAKYQTPDPLNFFLKKQALQVSTSQILDLLLPEYNVVQSLSSPGGGMMFDAKAMLKRNLNPFKRKTFEPMVFWSGIVDSNNTEQEFKFTAPSYFNGQMRIMAVAVNDFALGVAEEDIIVRSPIIISPSVPTNITPGDIFDLNVNLTNNIETNDNDSDLVTLNIKTQNGLAIIGSKQHTLSISKKDTSKITLKAKALNQLGAQEIEFSASSGNRSNNTNFVSTLSVRPATLYRTTINSGSSTKSKTNVTTKRDLYGELSEVNLSASKNPIIFAQNLGRFLKKYPHGCSEQITSQLFSFLTLVKFGEQFTDVKAANESYNIGISKLRPRQSASGGMSLWSGQNSTNDFVSIYIAHLLTEARELYYPVPQDMKNSLIQWLETYIEKHPSSLNEARLQSYAAYILTRHAKVVTPKLIALEEYLNKHHQKKWKSDITSTYLAASYQILRDRRSANRLVRDFNFPHKEFTNAYEYYNNSLADDAQYLYLVGNHFPEIASKITAQQIKDFIHPILQNNYNTLSASYTILALTSFANDEITNHVLDVLAQDKAGNSLPVNVEDVYNIALSNKAKEISITNKSDSSFFYALTSSGFDKPQSLDKISDTKIQVSKNYLNQEGHEINSMSVGEEIEVVIKVKLFQKNNIYSAVIIDLLPGGFEIVANSLKASNLNFNEKREDRNIFYTGLQAGKEKEIRYKIKAISSGEFTIPATQASDMYDSGVNGKTSASKKIIIKGASK